MKVFGKVQKKKRKLTHSSWACVLALLQRWRSYIGLHPVLTLAQHHCLLVLACSATCCQPPCQRPCVELAREFFFHFGICDEASHRFTPGSDCKTLVLFSKPCCAFFFENACSSSAGRYGRTTNLRLQTHWKRKRKSAGKINVERIGQDR